MGNRGLKLGLGLVGFITLSCLGVFGLKYREIQKQNLDASAPPAYSQLAQVQRQLNSSLYRRQTADPNFYAETQALIARERDLAINPEVHTYIARKSVVKNNDWLESVGLASFLIGAVGAIGIAFKLSKVS